MDIGRGVFDILRGGGTGSGSRVGVGSQKAVRNRTAEWQRTDFVLERPGVLCL